MKYLKILQINKTELDKINKLLEVEPQSKDECFEGSIIHTVEFDNGITMDIILQGIEFSLDNGTNAPWAEAILRKNGEAVVYSEIWDEYEGTWTLEYDGDTYTVIVEAE